MDLANFTQTVCSMIEAEAEGPSPDDHNSHAHFFDGHDGGRRFYEICKRVTSLYIFPVVSVLGIVGNLFIALIYYRSKKFSTNVYLIAISLCDTIKLANDFLYFIVNLVEVFDKSTSNLMLYSLYNFSHYIFLVSAMNTSWLTCAIAIDRWHYITHKSAAMKQHRRRAGAQQHNYYFMAIGISVAIVLVSVLINIPAPLFVRAVLCTSRDANGRAVYHTHMLDTDLARSALKEHYNFVIGLIKAVLPFILLVYLNYKIIRFIYRVRLAETGGKAPAGCGEDQPSITSPAASQPAGAVARSKSRITHMLVSIVLCFTVCILPDAILSMMKYGYATTKSNYIRGIRELTDTLLALNSATTFLICVYFSTEFRRKFLDLFHCGDNDNRSDNVPPPATPQQQLPLLRQQQQQQQQQAPLKNGGRGSHCSGIKTKKNSSSNKNPLVRRSVA